MWNPKSSKRRMMSRRDAEFNFNLRRLWVETLELRQMFAANVLDLALDRLVDSSSSEKEYTPVIVAGDPNGTPTDSAALRVDPNTTSAYAGVGSLYMTKGGPSGYICTGTLIAPQYVLTAGHCLDTNSDGAVDFKPGNVRFNLNAGSNFSHQVYAAALYINPNFTGFNHPAVNDDIAVIKLATAITNVAPYALKSTELATGTTLAMVGYGQSGDGVGGYNVSPSLVVKRLGFNVVDAFAGNDEASIANEVYYADFDGPTGNGVSGGSTLGNDRETTLGGGDSGGPGFVGSELATINTFTYSTQANAGKFGSEMGGILVYPYLGWINSVLAGGSGGGGGGGGKGGGKGPPSGQTGSLAPITSESFPMNFGSIIISSSTPANGGFSFSVADSLFEHPTSLQTTPIMEESHWDEPVQVAAAHIAHLKVGAVDNESKSDTMQKRKRVESIDMVHTDWSSEDSNLYDSLFRT